MRAKSFGTSWGIPRKPWPEPSPAFCGLWRLLIASTTSGSARTSRSFILHPVPPGMCRGQSLGPMTARLAARGIKTPRGGAWTAAVRNALARL